MRKKSFLLSFQALKIAVFMTFLGFVSLASAGRIREVRAEDSRMHPILLKLGKSTVLRFPDKPTKVVMGNSNYYKAEFVERDVTLQPQGSVATNMFVYTKKASYGFLLSVGSGSSYDDLVEVVSKSKRDSRRVEIQVSKLGQKLDFSKSMWVSVDSVKYLVRENLYLIDCRVFNKTTLPVDLGLLMAELTRSNRPLATQQFSFDRETITGFGQARLRVVVSLKEKRGFTLHVRDNLNHAKIIISRRHL